MKSFYKALACPKSRAGFSVIFNSAINICKCHYEHFKNDDVLILNDEIDELFETKKIFNPSEFNFDIEAFYNESEYQNPSNAHVVCENDLVKEKNKIFNMFFKLKNIEEYIIEKNNFIDDNTLTIHLRGTDKPSEMYPPTLESICQKIDRMINLFPNINSIFLATDDIYYQNFLISRYGNMVKYRTQKKISLDGRPLHFIEDRSSINKELMIDVYLLSQSKYFLYCFSNVSYLVLTMGIDNFVEINCLNN
jgi:hypothetical protein